MTGLIVLAVVAVVTGLVVAAMLVDHHHRKAVARRPNYPEIEGMERELFDKDDNREV